MNKITPEVNKTPEKSDNDLATLVSELSDAIEANAKTIEHRLNDIILAFNTYVVGLKKLIQDNSTDESEER